MTPAEPVTARLDTDGAVAATVDDLRAERRRLRRLSLRLGIVAGFCAVVHVGVVSTVRLDCQHCHAAHIWLRW